ncbi:MAG: ATP-binding protein [Desulfuromonadales bacterium]|nr:ATP-binding protein [Desulfuromonadales bacterium]
MRKNFAITKNARRVLFAVNTLNSSSHGTERMGLLYGMPGEGKSCTADWCIDKTDGIVIRAKRCMTMTSFLQELATELRCPEKTRRSNRSAVIIDSVIEHLNERPRPLFVDEIDTFFSPHNLKNGNNILETIRDIHDSVSVPILLIGEENSAINVQENSRFARRVTQWIELKGIDLEDTKTVATTICEATVADDLLDHLYQEAGGNIGRIVIALDAIERHCKAAGVAEMDVKEWSGKALFFDQPAFARKRGRA